MTFAKFFAEPWGMVTNLWARLNMVGTFCRTVVWPCIPPLVMYQYIRAKDEDCYITEILYARSGSKEHKAFYDTSRVGGSGHWRIQQDMETIRAAANAE